MADRVRQQLGNYRLIRLLGKGGFAEVYLGEHLYLKNRAALKVLRASLADEDAEQDPDRWCSHSAWGQECWQVVSQWVWNLRLELGHQLAPDPVRTTEFAPALPLRAKRRLTLLLPPRGMDQQPWPCPGRLAASRVKTLPFNPMARCAVRLANRWLRMSGAEKPTGACVWSMRPVSGVVVPVPCASSANGMAGRRPNRVK